MQGLIIHFMEEVPQEQFIQNTKSVLIVLTMQSTDILADICPLTSVSRYVFFPCAANVSERTFILTVPRMPAP